MGADLDLDRLPTRPDHRRVQGLVHVELGHRDEVLEPARDRVPPRVQGTERGIAVPHRLHEHSDADQVVDLREVPATNDHLLVDRVVVLRSSGDRRLHLRRPQVRRHTFPDHRKVLVPGRGPLGDQVHDLLIHLRVQRGERQVLELPLDRVHPEPVCQRCVDLQGLARLAPSRVLRDETPGPGVVQPVGELDHQHPDVPGHRDDHLPDGLGLGRIAVGNLVELGHPVDEHRDLLAEILADPVERVVGVLGGVMQQGSRQRRRRHPEIGKDRRHGDGMGDVRVPAAAGLAAVRRLGRGVRPLEDPDVGARMVGPDGQHQRLEDR